MPFLAYYELSTGLIQGVWTAALVEHLTPNIDPENATYGYLVVEDETLSAALLQERYWVQDGALAPATEVTLLATPNPFQANGLAECTIRPDPFVACTLLVTALGHESAIEVTSSEDPLILTADVPEAFTVRLAPRAGTWATPVRVEAT
jgi:hypothetical protein